MSLKSIEDKIKLIAQHIGEDADKLLADAHADLDAEIVRLEALLKKKAPVVEAEVKKEADADATALEADAGKDLTKDAAAPPAA